MSAKLESEISEISNIEERNEFLIALNLVESGLEKLAKSELIQLALLLTDAKTKANELRLTAENNVKKYFYSSSACVYNASKQKETFVAGLKEDDAYPADPEDGYGWEKLFSERMCRHFKEDFGLETRVVR